MDETEHTYTFPDYTLESAATVKLYTGEGVDSKEELYWGRSDVWNNDGDVATLYDMNGEIVDKYEK